MSIAEKFETIVDAVYAKGYETGKSEGGQSFEVDNTPTEGSTNLITSGGVYEALQNIPSGGGGAENFVITASFSGEIQQGVTERISIDKSHEDILAAYENNYNLYVKLDMGIGMEFIVPLIGFDDRDFWFKWQNVVGDMFAFDIEVNIDENGAILTWWPAKTADVEENSIQLITSGGVYEAIGDIETSLENIIAKYGLGGEA